jgi:hypothetical protein
MLIVTVIHRRVTGIDLSQGRKKVFYGLGRDDPIAIPSHEGKETKTIPNWNRKTP